MHRHHQRLVPSSLVLFAALVVLLLAAAQVDARPSSRGQISTLDVKVLWKTKVGKGKYEGGNAAYFDPTTNWVYVNFAKNMSILNANTGAVVKSVATMTQDGTSGVVPAGTMVCANENTRTVCHYKKTLVTAWQFGVPGSTNKRFQTTPLYVASKHAIYSASDQNNTMFKLDATTGRLEATSALFPGYEVYDQQPLYSQKYNLVLAGGKDFVAALNADTLSQVWTFEASYQVQSTGVFSEDESIVYYASDAQILVRTAPGTLYALTTASGKLVWKFTPPQNDDVNAFVYSNNLLYVATGMSGICYAFHAATGKQIWSIRSHSSIDLGSSYIYGDTVLFPGSGGPLAMALNGTGLVWQWANASGYAYNFPAPTADGKLFLTDSAGYAYALQLPPKQ